MSIKKIFSSILCMLLILSFALSPASAVGISSTQSTGIGKSVESNQKSAKKEKKANYLVKLKDNEEIEGLVRRGKLKADKQVKKANTNKANHLSTSLTDEEYETLLSDPAVLSIEPNGAVTSLATGNYDKSHNSVRSLSNNESMPWGVQAIGADLTLGNKKMLGKGVKIALLDTGISPHPDLKIAGGVSFVDGSTSYVDDNGHGTHIAGTIAALDNQSGVVGVAPEASLYAVKVLDKNGVGSYNQVIDGIYWSIENGIDIISMSLGGTESSEIFHEAIKKANDAGIVIVAAAGNMGYGEERVVYPARFPEAISVGSVMRSHARSVFSSTGSDLDLMAPGSAIASTSKDGDYAVMSGTSMAVPHVTGAAAALLSSNKKWTNEQLRNALLQTATPLGEKSYYGNGLLNVAKAAGLITTAILPVTSGIKVPETISTELKALDAELLGLDNKLLHLKQQAERNGDLNLAKEIERTYSELQIVNLDIHRLPYELESLTKEQRLEQETQTLFHQHYSDNIPELTQLVADYTNAILRFTPTLLVSDSSEQAVGDTQAEPLTDKGLSENAAESVTSAVYGNASGITINSYNKIGDSQTITAGSMATVGLYLDTAKTQINISVYPSTNPSNIVASRTYTNSPPNELLTYSWQTTTSRAPGTYTIRWHYPEAPEWDDYFTVYVTAASPPSTSDTYESNNTTGTATSVSLGSSYNSSISYNGDIDFYRLKTGTGSGTLAVKLDVPTGLDYDIYVYDIANNVVASGTSGTGIDENFSFSVKALGTYYLKVEGFNGAYGKAYGLVIGNVSATVPRLYENSPVDVSMPTGEYRVYRFIPAQTGNYRIFTGPYGGYGSANDTHLQLYSNANLTTLIAENDDSNGTLFSSVKYIMSAGLTYYIKLKSFDETNGSVYARLTVGRPIPAAQELALDLPIDVQVPVGAYRPYKYTPSKSGKYSFETNLYGGTGEFSDTYLHLYSDSALLSQLAFDDDSGEGSFSKLTYELTAGVTYYIKLSGYLDSAVNARLTAHNVFEYVDVYIQAYGESGPSFAGEGARYYTDLDAAYVNFMVSPTIRSEMKAEGFLKVEDGTDWLHVHRLSHYYDISYDGQNVILLSDVMEELADRNTNTSDINIFIRLEPVAASGSDVSSNAGRWLTNKTGVMIVYGYLLIGDGKAKVTVSGSTLVGTTLPPSSWVPSIQFRKTNAMAWAKVIYPIGNPKKEKLTWGTPQSHEIQITETAFYQVDFDIEVNVPGNGELNDRELEYTTPWILSNRVGEQYWDYVDPNSEMEMTVPKKADWDKEIQSDCGLSSSERGKYRLWYDSTYGPIPNGWTYWDEQKQKIDWNYEIHHIRPCEFGGDNSYDNLIPLPKDFHRSYVSPWWSKYGSTDTVHTADIEE